MLSVCLLSVCLSVWLGLSTTLPYRQCHDPLNHVCSVLNSCCQVLKISASLYRWLCIPCSTKYAQACVGNTLDACPWLCPPTCVCCIHQYAYTVSINIVYAAINACIDPHMYMCVCLLMLCACANLHVCTETVCVF